MFIPAGVFHRLRNDGDEPFVLLTIWPQPAEAGANGIHDERLETWGTGFRLREGCGARLVADGRPRGHRPGRRLGPVLAAPRRLARPADRSVEARVEHRS